MQKMATCLDEKLEIYWVKTEDYPWWPAQVNVDLGNDVQLVCSEEEAEASEKDNQRKDGKLFVGISDRTFPGDFL